MRQQGSLRPGWAPRALPPLHRVRVRQGRPASCSPSCSLTQTGLTVAATRGVILKSGLAKGPWPALLQLAAASQLALGHPAAAGLHPLLGPQTGEAAWLTIVSFFTLAASMSGVLYYMARTTWEGMEPYVFQHHHRRRLAPVVCHGVDVSGSRFFSRPAVLAAADFAAQAHSGQVRKTRQPYVTHCIETALIVEGLLSPTEEDERAEAAVVAALLHDVLDDTDVDFTEVEARFGEQVASMVSKVSQLSTTNQIVRRRLRVESTQPTQEEESQLRNMILTMVGEPLVIAIKLADRLHNMRTVYALSPVKQQAVASETRRVWCSLAERLGMFALKSELEDLCFAVLQPGEYRKLRRELDALCGVPTIPSQAVSSLDACLEDECECTIDETGTLHLTTRSTSTATAAEVAAAAVVRERQRSHAAASTSSKSTGATASTVGNGVAVSGSASSGGAGSGSRDEDWGWLTPPQQETRELIETVLPFDATTFNIAKLRSGAGGRRGLEVLQACAQLLMREIGTESLASGLEVSVQGRLKSLYSTFRKMARKGVPLAEVFDARALRVVVDDDGGRRQAEAIAACYKLLPAVHRLFRRVAGEEDDYIALPKPSGYQSLHTAVIGPGGVPMEVQMRTSSMHSDAEYGKAAHWAYKEKPPGAGPAPAGPAVVTLAPPSGSSSSSGSSVDDGPWIEAGQPVLHIGPGGRLRDGVVVQSEYEGARLLCAISQEQRALPDARPAPAAEYRRLLSLVEEKGYFQASQGNMAVALELFTLCSDGKYHRLDRFGHKLSTVVVPLTLEAEETAGTTGGTTGGVTAGALPVASLTAEGLLSSAAGASAPEHVASGGGVAGSDMEYMNNRIRLLRSMLEWGAELGASIAAESASGGVPAEAEQARDADAIAKWTESQLALPTAQGPGADVMVVVWPGGRILRVPRGTTAGSVIRDLGLIEITPDPATGNSLAAALAPPAATYDASKGIGVTVNTVSPAANTPATAAAALAAASHGRAPAGAGSASQRGSSAGPPTVGLLVNVNNRLVPEETRLLDGDYVVLSRDRVRI